MNQSGQRYLSLDVLRGLTVAFMIVVNSTGNWDTTYWPLLHAQWHGFTPTDLVFPTFMFVVGTALSLTLPKYAALGNAVLLKKVFTRTAIIFLCGYLMYWFPFVREAAGGGYALWPIVDTRIPGVLQRIALGYGFAALILHFLGTRGAIIFSIAALLGYWALLAQFGDYTLVGNAALKLDLLALGESHLYRGEGIAFDPEGISSTLPAIVNVIAGYFAGRFLQQAGSNARMAGQMIGLGLACIVVALLWNSVFPINKKLWTSSYVFLTVGLDLLLLALLVSVIEIKNLRTWTYFFEVFGRNTLFIYLLSELGVILLMFFKVGGQTVYSWIYAHIFQSWAGDYTGALLFAVSWMLICWSVGWLLDKQKIYIKV